jgi:hypothetical protein
MPSYAAPISIAQLAAYSHSCFFLENERARHPPRSFLNASIAFQAMPAASTLPLSQAH